MKYLIGALVCLGVAIGMVWLGAYFEYTLKESWMQFPAIVTCIIVLIISFVSGILSTSMALAYSSTINK